LRPALATTKGPLILISSPYAKKGEVYRQYKLHYGPAGDPLILVAKAPSLVMNPSLDERVVHRAMQNDRAAAMAEYGAEFRSDICNFVDRDIIEANVMTGVRELMPSNATTYRAFADPSGGSSDSFTLAIAHYDGKKETCIIDCVREIVPPFSPEAAVAELSQLMKSFHIGRVTEIDTRGSGLPSPSVVMASFMSHRQ
jgi:hypothetical protein